MKLKNLFFFLPLLIISCASTPDLPEPQWVRHKASVYSENEYLSMIGKGKTSSQSDAEAANNLGTYLKAQIKSTVATNYHDVKTSVNGKSSSNTTQENIRNIELSVDTNLPALEYETPWYDKTTKTWYSLAYIKKSTAFGMIKPQIDSARMKFYSDFNRAQNESEPFTKIHYFQFSKGSAAKFEQELFYASLFSQSLVDSNYSEDRNVISSIDTKIHETQLNTPFFIQVDTDSSNAIMSAVAEELSSLNFSVTSRKGDAAYIVSGNVKFNTKQTDYGEGLVIYNMYPDLTLSVKSARNGKTLYTYNVKSENTYSYYENRAQQMACNALSKSVRGNFSKSLSAYLDGNE